MATPAAIEVLEVVDPGLLTTIQDGGRPGLAGEGVTTGGAADTWSLGVANVLVGNAPSAAALEATLLGPTVRAIRPVTVGVAGTLRALVVETGERVDPGVAIRLRAGWTLAFADAPGGARGYVAVPGGFDVPVVLGSRSTALGAGFGGLTGRALRAGDRLAAGAAEHGLTPPPARWPGQPAPDGGPIRILPGPHAQDLDPAVLRSLVDGTWTVDPASDRVGLRLAGPLLPGSPTGELASHGVVTGAIQLPPDRRPIVLLVDHQPTGGYPVAAVVIRADLPRLAQVPPGGPVRLALVTPADARRALRDAAASFTRSVELLSEAGAWDDLWQGAGG